VDINLPRHPHYLLVIHERSLTDLASGIRRGQVSAREVIDHYLQRSRRLQPELNAYTSLDDRAMERADHIDHEVSLGRDPGTLVGIPLAIKDLIDQEGATTTCGSGFYRLQPERSAIVVQRLEAAGAIIIGRTGLHEFAFGFSSENDWFGPVRNPWDTTTSPGGSSGGSGVAAAGGLAAGAIGTDTGGSVRVPAALCGVVGLKVTHGRVPLTGVFPLASSLDTVGPLGRNVDDVGTLFAVMGGHDPADPWSVPRAVSSDPEFSFGGLRVGVPQPWVADGPMTEEVREAFSKALDRLDDLGAVIREIRDPLLTPSRQLADLINGEVAAVHRDWLADPDREYGPEVAERLKRTLDVTLAEYVAAQQWRAGLRNATAAAFNEVDVLVTPTTGATRKTIGEPTILVDGQARSYRLVLSWFSSLVNHMGVPALALPMRHPGSPPPSLQVIGPWWSEQLLLNLGRSLEAAGVAEVRRPPLW
jgi:aspartyl-tRNA(Asn)/glutamyl-tRNA(Gln) amidotransferase subunit A